MASAGRWPHEADDIRKAMCVRLCSEHTSMWSDLGGLLVYAWDSIAPERHSALDAAAMVNSIACLNKGPCHTCVGTWATRPPH